MSNSTTTNDDCQHLFCPMCGAPMTYDGHVVTPRSHMSYWQITCDTIGCRAYRYTTSDISLENGAFLASMNLKAKFDIHTGADLLLQEIAGLRHICKLALLDANDDNMTAAFEEDTNVQDRTLLVEILRDWAQVLTGSRTIDVINIPSFAQSHTVEVHS